MLPLQAGSMPESITVLSMLSLPGLPAAHHVTLVEAASGAAALHEVAAVCLVGRQLVCKLRDAEVDQPGAAVLRCTTARQAQSVVQADR